MIGTAGKKSTDKYLTIVFFCIVFMGLLLFFSVVHPLYIYDMDDWTYIVLHRRAIPVWKNWNPTRVLPESLMPLAAELGVRIFMPFNHDYILSMSIVFGLLVSTCYTIYFYLFWRFLNFKTDVNGGCKIVLCTVLILMHFLPFMNDAAGNGYMYAPTSVTCAFYYTIPALLNAGLVLVFSAGDSVEEKKDGTSKLAAGIVVLFIYLAINSNMFQSILLAAYISGSLLIQFIEGIVCRKSLKADFVIRFFREKMFWVLVITAWFLALLMEACGGRAASIQAAPDFGEAVIESVRVLGKTLCSLNRFFIFFAAATAGGALFWAGLCRKERAESDQMYVRLMGRFITGMIITILYLVLLCARAGVGFLKRDEVFSGILFYVFLIMWISMAYIIKKCSGTVIFLPVVIYVLFFATVINLRSYKEINVSNYNSWIVKDISDDILDQVIMADRQGKEAIEVYVPVYHDQNNWPIALDSGERISKSLFVHGMIRRQIDITIVPAEEMNEKYHLY